MSWTRIVGVFLLLLFLLLAVLLLAPVPVVKSTELFSKSPVEVYPLGVPTDVYDANLEPLGKRGYTIDVSISPYNESIDVDLWVINKTSIPKLGNLTVALAVFGNFSSEYPYGPPFSEIKPYVVSTGITGGHGDLGNLDHNGNYSFVLLNFENVSQSVQVGINEQYVESYRTWLEPSPVTITLTAAVLVASLCLIVANPKRLARGAKGRHKKP